MANNNVSEPRKFRVIRTESITFFDRSGRPVNGYRVEIEFMEFNEIHPFDVSSLQPDIIRGIAETFIKDRKALSEL